MIPRIDLQLRTEDGFSPLRDKNPLIGNRTKSKGFTRIPETAIAQEGRLLFGRERGDSNSEFQGAVVTSGWESESGALEIGILAIKRESLTCVGWNEDCTVDSGGRILAYYFKCRSNEACQITQQAIALAGSLLANYEHSFFVPNHALDTIARSNS